MFVLLLVKAWPAQVKRGVGSGGSARPRLAAAMVVDWIFRDRNVIFAFSEVVVLLVYEI